MKQDDDYLDSKSTEYQLNAFQYGHTIDVRKAFKSGYKKCQEDNKWVNVTDALPDINRNFLALYEHGLIQLFDIPSEQHISNLCKREFSLMPITHWKYIELPE